MAFRQKRTFTKEPMLGRACHARPEFPQALDGTELGSRTHGAGEPGGVVVLAFAGATRRGHAGLGTETSIPELWAPP